MSNSSGFVGDNITITGINKNTPGNTSYMSKLIIGQGFGNNTCQNQVLIGSYSCPIISSNSTQIVCQIGPNSGLVTGTYYLIDARIHNTGIAIKGDLYTFQLMPSVTLISPNIGKFCFYFKVH